MRTKTIAHGLFRKYNSLMGYFTGLFTNIRFYILVFSALLAGGINYYFSTTAETEAGRVADLTQTYALIAVTYLYFALLASPLTRFFTFLPFRGLYLRARRGIGVSAFLFASLHVYYAFFGELGGFEGLQFLNLRYLTAIALGATSITILSVMAMTSFEFMVSKLSFQKWKFLHRFVYIVAIFTTIHALMLGSHFTDLSEMIPQIFSVALAFLLILEALRFDVYLMNKFPTLPKAGVAFFVATLFIALLTILTFAPSNFSGSMSLHEQHRQMAKESGSNNASMNEMMKNMPGMSGDKTKRYTVDWDYSEPVVPGKETDIKFRVYDASNGQPVNLFTRNYEQFLHLIIVNSSLDFYSHIHPEFKDGWFQTKVNFPSEGSYNLYLDFVPVGAIEQQIGLSLHTAGHKETLKPSEVVDENLRKPFGDYEVKLSFEEPLKASEMSLGASHLKFEVFKDGQPVTTLKPYLGSFGHLVMINTKTYEYTHVHPVQVGNLQPDQDGGPSVEFMPMSLYAPIKPGVYRLFGQFNPDGELITTDFTVKVD